MMKHRHVCFGISNYITSLIQLFHNEANMIIPTQSIIHCHPQEFCVGAVGDKIIVKVPFSVY